MSKCSEYDLPSDEIDSDTETFLYSKLHHEWECLDEWSCDVELRSEFNNQCTKSVPNIPAVMNSNNNELQTDKKSPKRKKTEVVSSKRENSKNNGIISTNLKSNIEKSDNEDENSKYNQQCKTTMCTEVKQREEQEEIIELSSDSSYDSDCVVINTHNVATDLTITLSDSVTSVVDSQETEGKKAGKKKVKKKKRKKEKSDKKKRSSKKVKKIESIELGNSGYENMEKDRQQNKTIDPFPKRFDSKMSYREKMQKFYDSDCSLMDDSELKYLMKGSKPLKKVVMRGRIGLKGRYFGSVNGGRCENCRQWDHVFEDCPEPLKQVKCYLCGEVGHFAAGCPSQCCSICFQDGHNSMHCHNALHLYKVICDLCKCVGHSHEACPDLWRRYYKTTKPGPLVRGDPREYRKCSDMYCCNCGRKGHFVFDCRGHKMRPIHHPIWPFIVEYKDTHSRKYRHNKERKHRRSDDWNMKGSRNSTRGRNDVRSDELIEQARFLCKRMKSSHRSFKSKKNSKTYKKIKYNMKMRR